MFEFKQIKISKLLLDLENPRFTKEVFNQRDAINLMLELQGDKILNLAKDIVDNGLDPSENMIVRPSTENEQDGFYIVLEGNRRTAALKLLEQPAIAEKDKYRNKFSKLEQLDKADSLQEVRCVVIKDEEEYDHWISLKHTGDNKGVGRERWTTPETDRYNAKHGKISIQSQIYQFIVSHKEYYEEVLKNQKFIYATNLSRLFDKDTQKKFGLIMNDGYLYSRLPYEEFLLKLDKVLKEMVYISPGNNKPDFNVSRIYRVQDRKEFLNDIGVDEPVNFVSAWKLEDAFKNKEKEETKENSSHFTKYVDDKESSEIKSPNRKNNKLLNNINRNSLIPISVKLLFGNNQKCASIFQELKNKLKHDQHPYTISVMLRIFIDLSVSEFMESKRIPYNKKQNDKEKTPGLYDKVQICSSYLKEQGLLSQTQISAINAFAKDKLNAKGTLQQYVHNQYLHPSKDILNREWDNFEPLLKAIWSVEMQSE